MKDYSRTERVAQQLQKELSQIMQFEMADPKLSSLLSVMAVKLTPDFSQAKIYVSDVGVEDEARKKQVIQHLNHATGYIRRILASKVTMHRVPKLKFYYDDHFETSQKLAALISSVNPTDPETP